MVRCFIFDLDGVITDTAIHHFRAWKQIADKLNVNFTEEDNLKLKGVGREKCLKIILESAQLEISDRYFTELCDLKNQIYQKLIAQLSQKSILPGVEEKIKLLKKHSLKIAVASSSKNARMILNKIELTEFFDVIIDGNQIQNPKPNPEIFSKASLAVDVSPSECLVFEDAEAGIEAAVRAGMKTIGIGTKGNQFYSADYSFENFSQIPDDLIIDLIHSDICQ